MKIVGCQERCGKTAKQKMIKEMLGKMLESPYEYYYDDNNYRSLEEALEMERNYRLNCSDHKKDLSPEATNRRILNYMKKKR